MRIAAVDHITINCRNVAASFDFYERVLGLEKLSEADLGDHALYYYSLPGTRLELIVYTDPQKNIEASNTDTGIYRHIALVVDDLNEAHRLIKDAGCKINLAPTYVDKIGKTVMLFVDPNGVEIELIQA